MNSLDRRGQPVPPSLLIPCSHLPVNRFVVGVHISLLRRRRRYTFLVGPPLERIRWKPLTGMPDGAEEWGSLDYARQIERWRSLQELLTRPGTNRLAPDIFLRERRREFAIETGQIEGLYTLRRGITEQLITEGLQGVRSIHTLEGLKDATIQGLLADQEAALELVFASVRQERELSPSVLCEWHALLVRHQETVVGLTLEGRRVQVPFEEKGNYKIRPNNPRRPDGIIHEYCPPEQCRSEMDRLFSLYSGIQKKNYPVEAEAAWLHHRFVATHPFRDGNGRAARLLMAYAYVRRGLPPPVIRAADRDAYIDALEAADGGDLRPFTQELIDVAAPSLRRVVRAAERALEGSQRINHPNGGVTNNGRYYPPTSDSEPHAE